MNKCPTHFAGKLLPVKESVTIDGRFKPYQLDSTFSHIFCNCDNNLFRIFISDYPEVKCVCSACGVEHLIYDVSCYPAASGHEPDRGNFNKWVSGTGRDVFQVIAVWLYPEYPDHRDDLDWFVLITVDPATGEYTEIVNLESM